MTLGPEIDFLIRYSNTASIHLLTKFEHKFSVLDGCITVRNMLDDS